MKFPGSDSKFSATIQNYQEALACLEVASRYLRCGRKPHRQHQSAAARKLRPHTATGSSYAWGTRLGRLHWTAEVDSVDGNSCDYSSGSDCSGSSSFSSKDYGFNNERLQMDSGSCSRSDSPLNEPRGSYRLTPSCSKELYVPKALYANCSMEPPRSEDVPRPKTSDRVPDVFCGAGEGSSDGEVSSEDDLDHTAVTSLVERCSESIAAILAQPSTNSDVVQESLQSLVESLKTHKLMLEKLHSSSSCRASCGRSNRGGAGVENHAAAAGGEKDRCAVRSQVACMRSTPSGEGLGAVVGLEEVKEVLQEAFVWPAQMPHLFQGGALQAWSRLLLYGPPGTGKTRLARALAADLGCPLYTVTPSTLLSSWLGDSEKMVRELFKSLRTEQGPTVVFLDEMDALCRTRTSKEDDVTRRIKTELLVHLDSVGNTKQQSSRTSAAPDYTRLLHSHDHLPTSSTTTDDADYYGYLDDCLDDNNVLPHRASDQSSQNRVFVIAATNCPWDVDPAFLRRFQKRCYVPLPESANRRLLLEAGLNGCRCDLTEDDWTAVLDATKGYSGADLATVATTAAFRPVRQLHSARYWRFTNDNKIEPCSSDTLGAMQYPLDKLPANRVTARPVMADDLLSAAQSTPRSVSAAMLQQYEQYTQQ